MKNPDALYTVINTDTMTFTAGLLTYDEAKFEFFRQHKFFPNRKMIGWPGGSWNEASAKIKDPTFELNVAISSVGGKITYHDSER